MKLTVPYPPTANTYWRHVGNRVLISKEGRGYRRKIVGQFGLNQPLLGRLSIVLMVHPPDHRDLDNLPKALLDALKHAGTYRDDSQIDELLIRRCEIVKGGRVGVLIEEIQ